MTVSSSCGAHVTDDKKISGLTYMYYTMASIYFIIQYLLKTLTKTPLNLVCKAVAATTNSSLGTSLSTPLY